MTKNAKLSQKWPIYMRNISCDRASAFGVRNQVRTVQKRSGNMAPLPNSGPNERSVRGRSAFERVRRTERPHLYFGKTQYMLPGPLELEQISFITIDSI